jgi:hypothetical protein
VRDENNPSHAEPPFYKGNFDGDVRDERLFEVKSEK